jgi:hypothetical protein
MMPPSRYGYRTIGAQPLITGGAAPAKVSYNPTWCGQEVCGPPPGATAAAPKLIPLHFVMPVRPAPPPASAPAPPKVVPLHFYQPLVTRAPAPTTGGGAPPPTDMIPPSGGGGGGAGASPPPAAACSCAWWKVLVAAGLGFGVTYFAQNKKKQGRKSNPLRRVAA